jgi:hypothetical protein
MTVPDGSGVPRVAFEDAQTLFSADGKRFMTAKFVVGQLMLTA